MSEAQGTAVAAPKLNMIQIVERELANFFQQREKAIAHVHAIEGAIQASQHLLAVMNAEAARAEEAVVGAVETGIHLVESVAKSIETRVEGAVDAIEGEKP